MKLGAYLILKDKQFYRYDMKLLGGIDKVEDLKSEVTLLHIRDLDLERGKLKNLDVYDKLTYYIHVQVEIPKENNDIWQLIDLDVRLVGIPEQISNINKYKAIKIKSVEDLSYGIRDVVVEDQELLSKIGKDFRIFSLGFIHKDSFISIIKEVKI